MSTEKTRDMVGDKGDATASTKEFKQAVNMSAKVLTEWLKTDESKAVGFKNSEGGESVGHLSGRKIVEMLDKPEADFSSDDVAHARKVVGYIHRHSAQRPQGDISQTHWRYSLMNWGYDPLKTKT